MPVEAPGLSEVQPNRLAVTRETAVRVTGLSLRQIDYWAKTGLIGPSTDKRLTPGRRTRLYSFIDLLGLMVAAELKHYVSLQHIRAIVDHLRSRGYDQPLTQVVFAIHGKRVYFQHDDGTWENDIHPDQLLFHTVLNLKPLSRRIAQAARRDESTIGKVERRRGAMGSKPLIAWTRVPVDTVRRYLAAGRTTAQIVGSFPALTEADVEAVRDSAA